MNIYYFRTFVVFLFLLFADDNIQAQPVKIQWQKTLGGSGNDQAFSTVQTTDGGYVVAGFTTSDDSEVTGNHGGNDMWVVKLDDSGNIQWQRTLGGTGNEEAYSVQQTNDGGYIVAGETTSNDGDIIFNHGSSDIWVVKLNGSGAITWQKTYGGSDNDVAASIQQTMDSGYIVAGYTQSTDGDITKNNGSSDYWVLKLDGKGTIEWQNTFGGSQSDEATSVQQTNDGGYIVAGYADSDDSDVIGNHSMPFSYTPDFWVIKLTAAGNLSWQSTLGGTGYDEANSVQQTVDGGYIVAGSTTSTDGQVTGLHGSVDYWVVKLDNSGTLIWGKTLGGSYYDVPYCIKQTLDSGYVVAGYTTSNDGDVTGHHTGGTLGSDWWVVKIDDTGSITWEKTYGGSGDENAFAINQTIDKGYIIAGYTNSKDGDVTNNFGGNDYWVVKLDDTTVRSTNVMQVFNPSNISIYPTPTNGALHIEMPEGYENARLLLFDLLGNATSFPGNGIERTIYLTGKAEGLYVLRIINGDEARNYKIIYKP